MFIFLVDKHSTAPFVRIDYQLLMQRNAWLFLLPTNEPVGGYAFHKGVGIFGEELTQ